MAKDVGRIQHGSVFERAAADLRYSRAPSTSPLRVNLRALFHELLRLHFHPLFQRFFLSDALLRRVFPHVLRYLHAAKVWPAHGTEVRRLRSFLRQRLVVKLASGCWVEGQVELVFPSELESGF